jgi:hypothetical protein
MHLFIFQEVGYRHNFDLVEAEAKSEKVNDSQHDGRLRWGSSLAWEASRQRGATREGHRWAGGPHLQCGGTMDMCCSTGEDSDGET